jgi:hypothetical protein
LGPGTRSSPPATSNPALTRKLSRAVRNAAADRPALAWRPSQPLPDAAVLLPPSGPHFQTCWFLHLYIRTSHDTVQELFSHPEQMFLHALATPSPLHSSGIRNSSVDHQQSLTTDLIDASARGRALWRPTYAPGTQLAPACAHMCTARPCTVTLI